MLLMVKKVSEAEYAILVTEMWEITITLKIMITIKNDYILSIGI